MNTQSDHQMQSGLAIMLKLGEELLSVESIAEQEEIILKTASNVLECSIRMWLPFGDSDLGEFNLSNQGGKALHERIQELPPLMQTAVQTGCQILGSSPTEVNGIEGEDSTNLYIAVPILIQEEPIGVIQFSRENGPQFTESEIFLTTGLAGQISLSIQTLQKRVLDRHQLDLIKLVRSANIQISKLNNIYELANQVIKFVLNSFNYYYAAIFIYNPETSVLNYCHSALSSNPALESVVQADDSAAFPLSNEDIQIGHGIIGRAGQLHEAVISNNTILDQQQSFDDSLPYSKSEAAFPLIVGKQLLGVLDIQSDKLNAFNDIDIIVLNALADNIAIAVANAKLYDAIQKRINHLNVVTEISRVLVSILDINELLTEVIQLIQENLGVPVVHIYTVHPGRRKVFRHVSGIGGIDIGNFSFISFDLDDKVNPISIAAREGKTKFYKKHELTNFTLNGDLGAVLIVPLVCMDEILGVLEIQYDYEDTQNLDDQLLLESIADSVAIAVRNANLYHSESWRRQVADGMREVASLLTADTDIDQVLESILTHLDQVLPCDASAVWLMTDTGYDDESAQIRLAAIHVNNFTGETLVNDESRISASDILHLLGSPASPSTWLLDAVGASGPLIRKFDDPYEPIGAILDFPQDYSVIAAPMKIAEDTLGLLVLLHHTNGRYGHEAQNMTETLANYASIAIENARLYETAHDQAWVSTVLLRVAEATQSLNTLDELLSTMVRITPTLIGVDSCSIYLWENAVDSFVQTSSYGFTENYVSEDGMKTIVLGEIPSFDQLLLQRGPVFVDEMDSEKLLSSQNEIRSSYVLFPMMVHGDIIGAMLAEFSLSKLPDHSENLDAVDWEERFSIIQGIAHQTATALENLRLIEAQQDEAYVSIALLQVAQAVSSQNSLFEILETIVRITPILVGVRRSLIFVWNEDLEKFQFAQSYGITGNEIQKLETGFSLGDFPLLDEIKSSNAIVSLEVNEETESPIYWNEIKSGNLDYIDSSIGARFEEEEIDPKIKSNTSNELLNTKTTLMFGFPLSIKGRFLGVMITQELQPTSGYLSRQIREKRLEISIGITQQAALAIQNDLLQKEVVERERLEREFQLARDIQQTFLPDSLPKHKDWDLHQLWRPARQVSGDFYDVIELTENKWGIVIADVADKGMPAALYMTLIRTLIRAIVKEDEAPASVLNRVNDLLVEESKSGMFVTLVYAILSLDTGQFSYANAGHNLPILKNNQNGTLTKLGSTAMALGIFKNIDIGQKSVSIQKGDCLILYTDGITESFASDGSMFGEDRLLDLITQADPISASTLASEIDSSVLDFTQDNSASDDITLLIIKRR